MVLPHPTCLEIGAFYPVLGAMELTAELGYTTTYTVQAPIQAFYDLYQVGAQPRVIAS